ncbi:MAG: undecaprenyldiphospho-muramoylpentapeptide beta-N-acetylglucosaminyltransferase [Clostridia bacterium]|nr:undecaprenyldiphospho-muramoylpentapeptide beta-N-acetylglucosaminyltransferase [Clostridia bacterium]
MKIIISGGGTVGHVTPGIAIAETVLDYDKESKILFIGREGGDENNVIVRHGFAMETLPIHSIERRITFKNIKNAAEIVTSLKKAKKIIKNFSPDVVVGTGGYVCWPVIKAAQSLNIPTVMHESNAYPGLATRMLSKKCDRMLLNFAASAQAFKRKDNLVVVGNPLLNDLINQTKAQARRRLNIPQSSFLIVSFGGSGGADVLNKSIISLMQNYSSKVPRITHIHATGKKYYNQISSEHPKFAKGDNGCYIYPFIDDMPTYLLAADVAICRCGAMTLSEVAKSEVVPILIPSPNVTDNHQYKNGKIFVDANAALMIEEHELNDRTLLDAVRHLESNPMLRKRMTKNLSKFTRANCRQLILDEICSLISK